MLKNVIQGLNNNQDVAAAGFRVVSTGKPSEAGCDETISSY